MKKRITVMMIATFVTVLSTIPVCATSFLDFSGDWTNNKTLSAPGINNGTEFDGEQPSDFSSRTEYEDYMYNKYGKTKKEKLDPKKFNRLLLTEDGEVYDFRQSEETEKEIFIEYRLPILESLVNVQEKADNVAYEVNKVIATQNH